MQVIIDFLKGYFLKDNIVLTVVVILLFYQSIYLVLGFVLKAKKYPETNIKKRYAILIPARNEAKVIGNLIESINQQTYDKNLIDIFVVADNCTDNTAEIARNMGCYVYERFEPEKARKGWALEFLFNNMRKDHDTSKYDGYMFFDADNLLDYNFIHEINKAFVVNGELVTGYRNTKNFETNIISSAYGIHFYSSTVRYHRPRSRLGLGTHIAGTGFVIASKHLADGWKFFTLTEDSEITNHLASQNIKTGFCEQAVFFDEQPTNFFVGFRQRVRWTRGRLVVFFKYWHKMLFAMVRHLSFSIYDLFMYIFPWALYALGKWFVFPIGAGIIYGQIATGNFWLDFLKSFGVMVAGGYANNFVIALATIIRERKNIHVSFKKAVLYTFTYPWFNLITPYIALVAVLKPRVKWTPIIHDDNRKISNIIDNESKK